MRYAGYGLGEEMTMKEILRKIRKSRVYTLFGILIFIALCIGVGSFIAYVQHKSDPTEQVVEYFRAFVRKDYDKMYGCLNIDDGYYINKDMYTESMKKIRESMSIDSYEIQKPKSSNGRKVVTIKCKDLQTNKVQDFHVYLNGKRTAFQIVPDYVINIDDMMAENFSVTMPIGNYLELNGSKVDEKATEIITDQDKKTVTYVIDHLLMGQYKVSATNKYYAEVKNIKVEKANAKVQFTGETYTANDKYEELIAERGENVIGQFYKAVRERNPSKKKLVACFDNNKDLIKKVGELVQESQEIVYWPDTKNIDNYNVIDMKMSRLDYVIKYNPEKKEYKVTYHYSYDYVSATETALYTSYVYKLSGKCESTMKLTYCLKEDDIALTNISISNKNKKDGK